MNTTSRLFYAIKPLLPRRLQIALRRWRARRIFDRQSPPYVAQGPGPEGFAWKPGIRAAVLLTHDVETAAGQRLVNPVLDVENEAGVKSNWNFVLERYPLDMGLVCSLAEAGHEIGLHGLKHDGKLFRSESLFRHRMEVLKRAAGALGIHGFRSPSLLYDPILIRELPFGWDSSIPSLDPFQPQPGGSGSCFPFMLSENCVELPVTLWQDFTLFCELEQKDISVWVAQAGAIYDQGGLINVIVHPDYMTEEWLGFYRELVEYLRSLEDVWFALPSEVAEHVRCSGKRFPA